MKLTVLDSFTPYDGVFKNYDDYAYNACKNQFGEFDEYFIIVPKYISKTNDPEQHAYITRQPNFCLKSEYATKIYTDELSIKIYNKHASWQKISVARFVLGINDSGGGKLFAIAHAPLYNRSNMTDDDMLKLQFKKDVNLKLLMLTELRYFTNTFPYCDIVVYKDHTDEINSQKLMMDVIESCNQ